MNEITKWAVPFGLALSVWIALAVIRGTVSAIVESEKEKKGFREELARLKAKPQLDFQIHEAFIVPTTNVATCFLHISLHNEAGPKVDNPPVNAYSLTLTLKDKIYLSNTFIDPENYQRGVYKWSEYYDDEYGERREGQIPLKAPEPLYRIYTKIGDLVPGTRLYGWVAFAVHGLPSWDTDRIHVGSHEVYEYNDDGVPIEGSACLAAEYQEIPNTKNVEALTLTVVDAYNQTHTKVTNGPFSYGDKKITKREMNLPPDL